jgi:tetratricopeptide (TPR) repeat protein
VTLRRFCVLWTVWLWCSATLAQELAAPSDAQPAADVDRPESAALVAAREHVARGESLFDAGNFAGALVEFERAYALLVGHPVRYQTLYNLALCHERLFQYTEALTYYERYLSEGGSEASDADAVRAALRSLEGLLGSIVLSIRAEENRPAPAFELWLDGRKVSAVHRVLRVPSGRHRLEVRAEGYEPVLREVTISAREELPVSVELAVLGRGLPPALFWSAAGVTAAFGITTAVLGGRTLALRSELRREPELTRTEADRRALHKRALATDVGLAATGVFALGTTLLYFLTDWRSEPAERKTAHGLRVEPLGAGLAVSGRFR